jgi:hypothetical protein
VFGERHLRHVLLSYMKYYNEMRTHLSMEKDAPVPRVVDAGRTHSLPTGPGRIASPICPDLIYDRHRSDGNPEGYRPQRIIQGACGGTKQKKSNGQHQQ